MNGLSNMKIGNHKAQQRLAGIAFSRTLMATVESAVESSSQSTLEDDMETQPTQPEESSSQTPNLRRAQPGIQIATKQDRPDEHAQATAEARSTRERQQAIKGTDATRTGAVSRSPARTPSTPSPLLSRNMAGQKRMASGSLKRPSLAAAASTNPAATSPDPASPSRISKVSRIEPPDPAEI